MQIEGVGDTDAAPFSFVRIRGLRRGCKAGPKDVQVICLRICRNEIATRRGR